MIDLYCCCIFLVGRNQGGALQPLEPSWNRSYLGQCSLLPRKHGATFPLGAVSTGNNLLTFGSIFIFTSYFLSAFFLQTEM